MKINKKHIFILFSLMQYLKKVNSKFKNQPLAASVSKIDFIKLLQASKISEKSQRAIYKNLESLEKKKLISYENKLLKLTKKGLLKAKETEKEIKPYIDLTNKLEKKKLRVNKTQSYFK